MKYPKLQISCGWATAVGASLTAFLGIWYLHRRQRVGHKNVSTYLWLLKRRFCRDPLSLIEGTGKDPNDFFVVPGWLLELERDFSLSTHQLKQLV
jgi:hypothetical protein